MSRLHVDWTRCDGHGACAELLPELLDLDPWGYPSAGDTKVPAELQELAERAVRACPALALRLLADDQPRREESTRNPLALARRLVG